MADDERGEDGMTRNERAETHEQLRRGHQKAALGKDVERLLPREDRTVPDTVQRETVRERSIRRRNR